MSANSIVDILETPEYGTTLRCRDLELADMFEDFLTEHCFVLFKIKLDTQEALFFFGQASTPSKVRALYERFCESTNIKINGID